MIISSPILLTGCSFFDPEPVYIYQSCPIIEPIDKIIVPPLKTNNESGFDKKEAKMCKDALDRFRTKETYNDGAILDQRIKIQKMNALHPKQDIKE